MVMVLQDFNYSPGRMKKITNNEEARPSARDRAGAGAGAKQTDEQRRMCSATRARARRVESVSEQYRGPPNKENPNKSSILDQINSHHERACTNEPFEM